MRQNKRAEEKIAVLNITGRITNNVKYFMQFSYVQCCAVAGCDVDVN